MAFHQNSAPQDLRPLNGAQASAAGRTQDGIFSSPVHTAVNPQLATVFIPGRVPNPGFGGGTGYANDAHGGAEWRPSALAPHGFVSANPSAAIVYPIVGSNVGANGIDKSGNEVAPSSGHGPYVGHRIVSDTVGWAGGQNANPNGSGQNFVTTDCRNDGEQFGSDPGVGGKPHLSDQGSGSGSPRQSDKVGEELVLRKPVKLLCKFGGELSRSPDQGVLKYAGGETKIICIRGDVSISEFVQKMVDTCGHPVVVKYQLPDQDLDTLISVTSRDDLDYMMNEYERLDRGSSDGSAKLKVFLFPDSKLDSSSAIRLGNLHSCGQRNVQAVNGMMDGTGGGTTRQESTASTTSSQNSDISSNEAIDRTVPVQADINRSPLTSTQSPGGNLAASNDASSSQLETEQERTAPKRPSANNLQQAGGGIPSASPYIRSYVDPRKENVDTDHLPPHMTGRPSSHPSGTAGPAYAQQLFHENAGGGNSQQLVSAVDGTTDTASSQAGGRPTVVLPFTHPQQNQLGHEATSGKRLAPLPIEKPHDVYQVQASSAMVGSGNGSQVHQPGQPVYSDGSTFHRQDENFQRFEARALCQKALPEDIIKPVPRMNDPDSMEPMVGFAGNGPKRPSANNLQQAGGGPSASPYIWSYVDPRKENVDTDHLPPHMTGRPSSHPSGTAGPAYAQQLFHENAGGGNSQQLVSAVDGTTDTASSQAGGRPTVVLPFTHPQQNQLGHEATSGKRLAPLPIEKPHDVYQVQASSAMVGSGNGSQVHQPGQPVYSDGSTFHRQDENFQRFEARALCQQALPEDIIKPVPRMNDPDSMEPMVGFAGNGPKRPSANNLQQAGGGPSASPYIWSYVDPRKENVDTDHLPPHMTGRPSSHPSGTAGPAYAQQLFHENAGGGNSQQLVSAVDGTTDTASSQAGGRPTVVLPFTHPQQNQLGHEATSGKRLAPPPIEKPHDVYQVQASSAMVGSGNGSQVHQPGQPVYSDGSTFHRQDENFQRFEARALCQKALPEDIIKPVPRMNDPDSMEPMVGFAGNGPKRPSANNLQQAGGGPSASPYIWSYVDPRKENVDTDHLPSHMTGRPSSHPSGTAGPAYAQQLFHENAGGGNSQQLVSAVDGTTDTASSQAGGRPTVVLPFTHPQQNQLGHEATSGKRLAPLPIEKPHDVYQVQASSAMVGSGNGSQVHQPGQPVYSDGSTFHRQDENFQRFEARALCQKALPEDIIKPVPRMNDPDSMEPMVGFAGNGQSPSDVLQGVFPEPSPDIGMRQHFMPAQCQLKQEALATKLVIGDSCPVGGKPAHIAKYKVPDSPNECSGSSGAESKVDNLRNLNLDAHVPPKPTKIEPRKQALRTKDSFLVNQSRKVAELNKKMQLKDGLQQPFNQSTNCKSSDCFPSSRGSAEHIIEQELQNVPEGVVACAFQTAPHSNPDLTVYDGNKPAHEIDQEKDAHHKADSEDVSAMLAASVHFRFPVSGAIIGLQKIKSSDLEVRQELGSGTYGTVHRGKWRGTDVAIKRINSTCFLGEPSEQDRKMHDFLNEAKLLADLHHPNVVAFYGVVLDGPDGRGDSVATVTEFMVDGSLRKALQKGERNFDMRKRLLIAREVANGMEYLHDKKIVHFDLKSDNLLVNLGDPRRPTCKVGDLGLSKVKRQTLISGGMRGTLPWMAPELLNNSGNPVSEKVDVYSFGIVMWELLTGEVPYADLDDKHIIGAVLNNTQRPQVPASCDPEWKSLMERCWSSEPSERPSFTEIREELCSIRSIIADRS